MVNTIVRAQAKKDTKEPHISSTTRWVMNGVISMETQLSSTASLAKRRDFLDLRLREGDDGVELGLAETGLVGPEPLLHDIGETGVNQSPGRRFFKRRRGLFGGVGQGVARLNVGWYLSAIHSGCGIRLSWAFFSTRGTST